MRLANRVALVTGGSRGLGLAIARALGAEGAAVGVLARPGPELDRAVSDLAASGVRALALPADVTHGEQVAAAVQRLEREWKRLDVAVLNAGTWLGAPLHETTEESWDLLLDLNLKGAFLTLRHAIPLLVRARGATVVGIGSIGGRVGQAGSAAYSASKWGLRGLLESAALELHPRGVRVSVVQPHHINSEHRPIDPASPEREQFIEPEDIASLVTWICAAPPHVAVGDVTIWPIATGVRFD